MKHKRRIFAISFLVYPTIFTLMSVMESAIWSALLALPVALLLSGISLLPMLLLVDILPKPKKAVWALARAAGILIAGALALGGALAIILQSSIGIAPLELILYAKPMGAYLLSSLVYLACVDKEYPINHSDDEVN